MRRRDLAWLALFTDPLTRLSRPVTDVISPTCIILKDDRIPIPRCGCNSFAHVKDAVLTMLYGQFVSASTMCGFLSTRGEAQLAQSTVTTNSRSIASTRERRQPTTGASNSLKL